MKMAVATGDESKASRERDGQKAVRKQNFTKVIIRRLPPTTSETELLEQIAPLPPYDYFCFVPADASLSPWSYSRAYFNFSTVDDVIQFRDRFDGYVFVDSKGNEYPAIVELAPCQKIPTKKVKKDSKCGTIEKDPEFKAFLEELQNPKPHETPNIANMLVEIEKREKDLKENKGVLKIKTPLVEFIEWRKEERRKYREEKRRQKELERLERVEREKAAEAAARKKREIEIEKRRELLREKQEEKQMNQKSQEKAPRFSKKQPRGSRTASLGSSIDEQQKPPPRNKELTETKRKQQQQQQQQQRRQQIPQQYDDTDDRELLVIRHQNKEVVVKESNINSSEAAGGGSCSSGLGGARATTTKKAGRDDIIRKKFADDDPKEAQDWKDQVAKKYMEKNENEAGKKRSSEKTLPKTEQIGGMDNTQKEKSTPAAQKLSSSSKPKTEMMKVKEKVEQAGPSTTITTMTPKAEKKEKVENKSVSAEKVKKEASALNAEQMSETASKSASRDRTKSRYKDKPSMPLYEPGQRRKQLAASEKPLIFKDSD